MREVTSNEGAHRWVGLSIGPFADLLHQAQLVAKRHHHTDSISEDNATRQDSILSLFLLWMHAVSPRARALLQQREENAEGGGSVT